jgi:hypothetical protein
MFDRLRLVAEAEDEIRVAIVGVIFHYVPQDGHIANSDQRFWNVFRMILQPHSKAAAKKYDFHKTDPFRVQKFHRREQKDLSPQRHRVLSAEFGVFL